MPAKTWKTFYQVWIQYPDTKQWECVFSTSAPPAARECAYNRVSFGGVQRVEIRDRWGTEVLETVFDASWPRQDEVRAAMRRLALHFPERSKHNG